MGVCLTGHSNATWPRLASTVLKWNVVQMAVGATFGRAATGGWWNRGFDPGWCLSGRGRWWGIRSWIFCIKRCELSAALTKLNSAASQLRALLGDGGAGSSLTTSNPAHAKTDQHQGCQVEAQLHSGWASLIANQDMEKLTNDRALGKQVTGIP